MKGVQNIMFIHNKCCNFSLRQKSKLCLGKDYFNLREKSTTGEVELLWIKELPLESRSKGILELTIKVNICVFYYNQITN